MAVHPILYGQSNALTLTTLVQLAALVASFQEPIERTVIENGLFSKQLRVEVYPLEFKLCLNDSDEESSITQTFSRAAIIGRLSRRPVD